MLSRLVRVQICHVLRVQNPAFITTEQSLESARAGFSAVYVIRRTSEGLSAVYAGLITPYQG